MIAFQVTRMAGKFKNQWFKIDGSNETKIEGMIY